MKTSQLINKLQDYQNKYGDLEVSQLLCVCDINGNYLGEKIVPINKIKYNKKRNIMIIDFI